MSQRNPHETDDATLAGRLRPQEDAWSSLAVAQDDVLGDEGIPSPELGGRADAGDDEDEDGADSPVVIAEGEAAPEPASRHFEDYVRHHSEVETEDDDDVHARRPLTGVAHAGPDDGAEFDDGEDDTVVTMIDPAVAPTRGGAFTIPMVCAGVAIIAACLLIPQADANRRLAYQQVKLRGDLEAVERQVAVNDEFLRNVADDPTLAERLAQRQMKIIRPDTKVLALKGAGEAEMSPFQITAVAPPPKLPPYKPRGGTLAELCYHPKSRLYLLGTGLLLTAVGLVLGFSPRTQD